MTKNIDKMLNFGITDQLEPQINHNYHEGNQTFVISTSRII